MKNNGRKPAPPATHLPKCPTGIQGLDEITGGGLPRGGPTLVRKLPQPVRNIMGNLSDTERVLVGLDLIDVYQQPILARNGQIVATPTLVREFPQPVRRLIGNLSNTSGLFVGLNLDAKGRTGR